MARYSDHARDRMAERDISEAEVEGGLANHHTTYPSETDPNVTVLLADVDGRRIKLAVRSSDPNYVVSVMDRDQEG